MSPAVTPPEKREPTLDNLNTNLDKFKKLHETLKKLIDINNLFQLLFSPDQNQFTRLEDFRILLKDTPGASNHLTADEEIILMEFKSLTESIRDNITVEIGELELLDKEEKKLQLLSEKSECIATIFDHHDQVNDLKIQLDDEWINFKNNLNLKITRLLNIGNAPITNIEQLNAHFYNKVVPENEAEDIFILEKLRIINPTIVKTTPNYDTVSDFIKIILRYKKNDPYINWSKHINIPGTNIKSGQIRKLFGEMKALGIKLDEIDSKINVIK